MRFVRAWIVVLACALASCALPVAECTFRCPTSGLCPFDLTCGSDGYCHRDAVLDHCGMGSDGGVGDASVEDFNFVFVTSATYRPGVDFTSLETADALCQGLADAAQRQGTYRAWLSTATVDAKSRLMTPGGAPARGWVRTDGKPFADTVASLTSEGRIYHPPSLDERGQSVSGADRSPVATGTNPSGTATGSTAQSWSSSSASFTYGTATATTDGWTDGFVATGASKEAHLYCFGIDRDTPLTISPVAGRSAFVTQASHSPTGGLAAADALCASEAEAAQLSGTFSALMSTTSAVGSSRFSVGAPWVRLDGIVWADSLGALASNSLNTTLNVDSARAYRGDRFVWGGALHAGQASNDGSWSCANWSTASGQTGVVGQSSDLARWFDTDVLPCSTSNVLVYCLEN